MQQKTCTKCGLFKNISEFYISKGIASNRCKGCICEETKSRVRDKAIANHIPIQDLDGEVWKDIKGYNGIYCVSNLGRFKSKNNPHNLFRLLKPSENKDGYWAVRLPKRPDCSYPSAHRLVAEAFIQNPNNLPEVNHKKGIKSDNRASELEWVSKLENMEHAYLNGLMNKAKGEEHGMAKLKESDVLNIVNSSKSNRSISEEFGIAVGYVRQIKRGEAWSHITGIKYIPIGTKRLTEQEIIGIYNDEGTQRQTAKKYGVSTETVWGIKNGKYNKEIINNYIKSA